MALASCRFLLVSLSVLVFAAGPTLAQTAPDAEPLASGRLEIRGSRLTLYSDPEAEVDDAEQTINVGERAVVRTCFGGPAVPCGSVQAGDPRIAGLSVEAELAGPELPEPLVLSTVPGGSFLLPSFQQEGDYTLENIRLLSGVGAEAQVVALADPSLAVLHVRKIVLSSASVRALTLEELRARGIELTEQNFQAFDFAVGFAIEGQTVEIKFPVLFHGNGQAENLGKPAVQLDGLPAAVVKLVQAWQPPMVQPIQLEPQPARSGGLSIGEEGEQELSFPLYGAIVIPGTVTFLNQFFEAQLIVANGAPQGSGAQLVRLRALARLPGNQALRLAETDPPVVPGQWVPVLAANGSQALDPGEQGSAAWVVEGLKPGTHSLLLEIEGELDRPGREPLPVRSLAQAAVEVVDARFQLTFSHPDVVRKLEEYTLFVTVTNQSAVTQNQITVDLREDSLTGTEAAAPDDPLSRAISRLAAGESATVEFRLRSRVTGKVIASTYQSESGSLTGAIELRTGVGELGIPLSPATLLMPRFTSELEARRPELVSHEVALLGLAYSLAVAPAALLPPGLANLPKTDVERRAIDLAEAGERLYLGDGLLESLEALLYDQLGNRHPLERFDQLRRQTAKGLLAAEQMAASLRAEQQNRNLDAEGLFDHFAATMSYARPHLLAVLVPHGAGGQPTLEAVDRLGGAGLLAGTADEETGAQRSLPFGELYSIRSTAGDDGVRSALAVIGSLDGEATTTFLVRNSAGATQVECDLFLLAPNGQGGFRRLEFRDLTLAPGEVLAIDAGAAVADAEDGGFRPYDPLTLQAAAEAPDQRTVDLPDFEILGARQDFFIDYSVDVLGNRHQPNRYGNAVTYLFNRPPAAALSQHPERFRIGSVFSGQAADNSSYSASSTKTGVAAFVQPNSERVVIVRYDGAISPLIEGGAPLVQHLHDLADTHGGIQDRFGETLRDWVAAPRVEAAPQHEGGLVGGLLKRGSGDVVPGAKVELIRHRWFQKMNGDWILYDDLAAQTLTKADGSYFFDFIESPPDDPWIKPEFTLRALVPAGPDPLTQPAEVGEVSFTVRRANKAMVVNIALLGRGGVTGRLSYLDGDGPVVGGTVEAASTLFGEQQKVTVEADGSFRFLGLPVGPIALAGRDPAGRRVYATVAIAAPGAVATADLKIQRPNSAPPGRGTLAGRVLFLRDGVAEEALGAKVAVYSDGNFVSAQQAGAGGRFVFSEVPAGRVSLQAADFLVSRSVVMTDLLLDAGEVRDGIELRIPASSPKTLTGRVLEHDRSTGGFRDLAGATVLLLPVGLVTQTGADGRYLIENVPVQSAQDPGYQVQIVKPDRSAELRVGLPPVLSGEDDLITAATAVFEVGQESAAVRGIVYDPAGHAVPFADVVLYPYAEGKAGADGTFAFENVPFGSYWVVAHVDEGLTPGKIGWIGRSETVVVESGASMPFVRVDLRGSAFLKVHTRTSTAAGILTPIFYRPTYYSATAKDVVLKGSFIETSTNPNGDFEVELPLGEFVLVAYNPFHGEKEIRGVLTTPGELQEHEIVFEDLGKVSGVVLANDGLTPVPFAEVKLSTSTLLPQTLQADEQGRFLFELVPEGIAIVDARALVGNVERVGRTLSSLRKGEERELQVVLLDQGTISGRVLEEKGPGHSVAPLANAQVYLRETAYPHRRLPAEPDTYYFTDDDGRYEVPHVYAGDVDIVARDGNDLSRTKGARATLSVDWSRVSAPDIVFSGADAVGRLTFLVRDPQTGNPVPDALVRLLSTGEGTVTGSDGRAVFEALKVGTEEHPLKYVARAFFAPTGQAGESGEIALYQAGQEAAGEIYLDQRGEVRGFLFSDASRTEPIVGATVRISGNSVAGRVEGLVTTSGAAGELGRFVFSGIPEGTYAIDAASTETPRRAATTVALTDTSPIVDLFLYLELVGDRYFRIDEKLRAGNRPVDLGSGVFSVRLLQGPENAPEYSFTSLLPEAGTNLFLFEDLFLERRAEATAAELDGELRRLQVGTPDFVYRNSLAGQGTAGDPYRLVLPPKGRVLVEVRDADDQPAAGIDVRLSAPGASYSSATSAAGKVSFGGVNAGTVTVSARSLDGVSSGSASGSIVYDDDEITLLIRFQPAVSAEGKVYSAPPEDHWVPDLSLLSPMAAARVDLVANGGVHHLTFTDAAGAYRIDGLPTGTYTISAASPNGEQIASGSGTLLPPNGSINTVAPLVLDGGPPKIVQISPPSGATGVSTTTLVEVIFSERLSPNFLPVNSSASYFALRRSSGNLLVAGNWQSIEDAEGRQVVRFRPLEPLDDFALYSLVISGAVTDLAGRRLSASGEVGSSFRTSDGAGPTVVGTDPVLTRPVHPAASIRFDFNERVEASAEDLDGDGNADAAVLEAQKNDGSWVTLPAVYYLTRQNFSLQLDLPQGLTVPDDSRRRRITLSRLRDQAHNAMAPVERLFRLYDSNAPTLAVPLPAGAPDGNLYRSLEYVLVPELGNLDEVTPQAPGGDLDKVEYFFSDPALPATTASVVVRSPPFSYRFPAAYVGDGVTPRPFPIWVRAVDTSNNVSSVVLVDLRVLPSAPPSFSELAVQPAGGGSLFYYGKTIEVVTGGYADPDSAQLSLFAELYRGDVAPPQRVDQRSWSLARPSAGWSSREPVLLSFAKPYTNLPEGTPFFVRVRLADEGGLSAQRDSEPLTIADDTVPPTITAPAINGDHGIGLLFTTGERIQFRFQAADAESGAKIARIRFDRTDLFPASPLPTTSYNGNYFSTQYLTVPVVPGPTDVVATIEVEDYGGNTGTLEVPFQIRPAADPYAPEARFTSPFSGGQWPAHYTSNLPGAGVPLLLRATVTDTNQGADGQVVPGELYSIEFRGPELAPDGSVRLSETWIPATQISGQPESEVQALWYVPNDLPEGAVLQFALRAIDLAGSAAVKVVEMPVVTARRVYQGVTTAVFPDDPMLDFTTTDPNGPVFFLDGTVISIYPQPNGGLRTLPGLFIYSGGFVNSGYLTQRVSKLVPVEINSLDSAVLYYPLELGIANYLGVGRDAAIDGDGAGLLGGTLSRPVTLPGVEGPRPSEVGYHGGLPYAPIYGPTELLRVYDDPRWPLLPGLGGRRNVVSSDFRDGGGPGGAAIRLEAAAATVHLEGNLTARGRSAARGNNSGSGSPGGAGGSIAMRVGRLEGGGGIDASGYGGGGGRVALHFGELAEDFDSDLQVRASNGTVYLEPVPAEGVATGVGSLRVADEGSIVGRVTVVPGIGAGRVVAVDPVAAELTLDIATLAGQVKGEQVVLRQAGAELAAWRILASRIVVGAEGPRVVLEVAADAGGLAAAAAALAAGPLDFHGRLRYARIEAGRMARILVRDELTLGPAAAPSQIADDPAYLVREEGGRIRLRSEDTVIVATPNVAEGPIEYGVAPRVEYQVRDSLGVATVETEWSGRPARSLDASGADVVNGTESGDGRVAGPLSVTLRTRTVDDRRSERTLSWTVLENEPSTVTVLPEVSTIDPGQTLRVRVVAHDREGLVRIDLRIFDGVIPWYTGVDLAGETDADRVFTFVVPTHPTAPELSVGATVTDRFGARQSARTLVQLTGGSGPTAEWTVDLPAQPLPAGASIGYLALRATDLDGNLAAARITSYSGPLEPPQDPFWTERALSGSAAEWTFQGATVAYDAADGQEIVVRAEVEDEQGNVFTLPPRVFTTAADHDPPQLFVDYPLDGVTVGNPLVFQVSATDQALDRVEILFEGQSQVQAAVPSSWGGHRFQFETDPVGPGSPTRPLEVWAYDRLGNVAHETFAIAVLADAPPTGILEIAGEVFDPFRNQQVLVAGAPARLFLGASDDVQLAGATLSVGGVVPSQEQSFLLDGRESGASLEFVVPETAQVGDAVVATALITDHLGQSFTVEATGYVSVVGQVPPRLSLYLDPENADGRYVSGSTLEVVAIARKLFDSSADVTFDLAGQSAAGSGLAAAEVTLPTVATPTVYTLRARATGVSGLETLENRQITVVPASPETQVELTCPSQGALLPAGITFDFHVRAQAAAGIARVDLYRGAALAGSVTPAGAPITYEAIFPLALPGAPGPLGFRAVVVPTSGAPAESSSQIELTAVTPQTPSGIVWSSLEHATVALGPGTYFVNEPRRVDNLILLPGARITHDPRAKNKYAAKPQVDLEVAGQLYVACGAAVDVSGRGYYEPGNPEGGGHFGAGGLATLAPGNNLHQPRRPGGGSGESRGGGVARLRAAGLTVDGEILSEGASTGTQAGAGAGGSVWIQVGGALKGSGRISADGASTAAAAFGSGGGGVAAVEYGTLELALRDRISAKGGGGAHPGGAGALVLKDPTQKLGQLVIDGGDSPGAPSGPAITVRPIGPDEPATIREGAVIPLGIDLEVDPADYVGAVVEVRGYADEAHTRLQHDYYQVVKVTTYDGSQCPAEDPYCLCGYGGPCPPCAEGDPYCNCLNGGLCACPAEDPYCNCGLPGGQCAACPASEPFCNCGLGGACPSDFGAVAPALKGLLAPRSYQLAFLEFRSLDGKPVEEWLLEADNFRSRAFFDKVLLRGKTAVAIANFDTQTVEVSGEARSLADFTVTVESLFLRKNARLYSAEVASSYEVKSGLSASRDVVLARGASLEVNGAGRETSRDFRPAGAGASHLGTGGGLDPLSPPPSYYTYDSYGRPEQQGTSLPGASSGGGALSLTSSAVYLGADSSLEANAKPSTTAGGSSGGAIVVDTRLLVANGRMEALGGSSATQHGGGGGGIAVHWQEERGTWREGLKACGGLGAAGKENGGAGTVASIQQFPETAEETELIIDNCGRVGPVTYLEPDFSSFKLVMRGGGRIPWPAVIEGAGHLEIGGAPGLIVERIAAQSLRLFDGAVLSPPLADPVKPLVLRIEGDLRLESGGRIDASEKGLKGAYGPVAGSAGNHVGYKGYSNPAGRGKTYGSLTHPAEPGTGTLSFPGGGVIDIVAGNLYLEGANSGIAANGKGNTAGAAGGSVTISTGILGGDGFIEARGSTDGAIGAGGGAIAIELDSLEGSVGQNLRPWGGQPAGLTGGAGSIFLFDRDSATYGTLRLENNDQPGATELPTLGKSTAASGTHDAVLVTSLPAIPSFFVGHWVEVRTSAGALKNRWRVESISGSTLGLQSNLGEDVVLSPGDGWQGAYRFDRFELDLLASYSSLDLLLAPIVLDQLEAGGAALAAATSQLDAELETGSGRGEAAELGDLRWETTELEGLYRLRVPATTFAEGAAIDWIRLDGGRSSSTLAWDEAAGATFLWAGEPGDRLRLEAAGRAPAAATLSADLAPLPEPAATLGFGVNLDPEERILDLWTGGDKSFLLLRRADLVELLEIDREGRAIRSRGFLPALHDDYRLALQDGELGVAARSGRDRAAVFLTLGEAVKAPTPLAAETIFDAPAGANGRFEPVAPAAAAGNLQ